MILQSISVLVLLIGSMVFSVYSLAGEEGEGLALEVWDIRAPIPDDDPSGDAAPASNPASYPLEEDFSQRREQMVRGLAKEDLARWRRGYFTGGDPGKYLPGAAMARLLVDPEDAMARTYMNDSRSPREHYHFAAVNWARFIPLFGSILSEETLATFNERGGRYTDYITGGGTENHKTMQYTGPLVLPWYTNHGLGNLDRDATLEAGKNWIREYVQTIYQHGMGEWESSTYHTFTINGFLNVYDFAQDPEVRLIAKAALDYFVGAYALKYTDGILSGPSQRGFSRSSGESITDTLGWLWWGSSRSDVPSNQDRYASHAWTSRWRPNRVLTNIALRNLPTLPAEWRNSKSNYWFGQRIPARGNFFHESLFVDPAFTLGSLWAGWDRHGQTVRWQLTAQGTDGAITFTGGHPVMGRSWDGLGRYEQSAQAGSTLVLLAHIPEDDPHPYTFMHIPANAQWPERHGPWWIIRAHNTWVALRSLNDEEGHLGFAERTSREARSGQHPGAAIIFPGRQSGFIVQVSNTTRHADLSELQAALDANELQLTDGQQVAVNTFEGQRLQVAYQAGERYPAVQIDGEAVLLSDWPVFDGPYFQLAEGVLRAHDGNEGYQVDFTGDLPVYSPWTPDP